MHVRLPAPVSGEHYGSIEDTEVMREEEIESIRVTLKSKNSKSRKKRGAAVRVNGGSGATRSPSSKSPGGSCTVKGEIGRSSKGSRTRQSNGHMQSNGTPSRGSSKKAISNATSFASSNGNSKSMINGPETREAEAWRAQELRSEFADSDDEIPLPPGVPAFRNLEEAMLVRELKKDRLPGRIIRGRDGMGKTVRMSQLSPWGIIGICFSSPLERIGSR